MGPATTAAGVPKIDYPPMLRLEKHALRLAVRGSLPGHAENPSEIQGSGPHCFNDLETRPECAEYE